MAEMKAFLKQRGLNAELIAKLETDGELTVEKDGMRLEVGRVELAVTKLVDKIRDRGLRVATMEVVTDIWSGTKSGLISGIQKLDRIFKNIMDVKNGNLLKFIANKIDERVATSNDFTTILGLLVIAGVGTMSGLFTYLSHYKSEKVGKNLKLGQRVLVEVEPGRTENWSVSQINEDGTVLVVRTLPGEQMVVRKFSLKELSRLNPSLLDEQLEIDQLNDISESSRQMLRELFPKGIEGSHFEQGNTGNCYFLAALHAIKNHPIAPYLFASMIRKNGDGSWSVTFPGYEVVTVKPEELRVQEVYNSA